MPETEIAKRVPFVIGFPGFAHASERTRIDNLFEKLKKCGIVGVRINYPGIVLKEEGRVVECQFNLQAYVKSAKNAREEAAARTSIDASRIGIFDSSIGSGIAGHWLARDTEWCSIRCSQCLKAGENTFVVWKIKTLAGLSSEYL